MMDADARADDVPEVLVVGLRSVGVELAPGYEVVRDFPWSRVLRLVDVDSQVLWAKWCGDGMSFEPSLVRVIERLGPSVHVASLWSDERWIVTEQVDGQLRRGDAGMIAVLRDLQVPVVQLQRRLAERLEEVRLANVPSLGPDDVAPLVDRAIAMCATRVHLGERPMTRAEAAALVDAVPRLRRDLEVLTDASPSMSVQHLDLHHGNVFAPSPGIVRCFDWGDARIGSPWLHVVSTASLLAYVLGVSPDDSRIAGVVDAYCDATGLRRTPAVDGVVGDARLAAFLRMDALVAALGSATDESLAPFADWLPDIVRAAGAATPAGAAGVRLA